MGYDQSFPKYKDPCIGQLAQDIVASLRSSSERRFVLKAGEQYSVPNNTVDDSKIVDDLYVSPEDISIIDPTVVESCTPIFDEACEFSEGTSDDVDMRVESSTLIPTDIHTRDNDTSNTERESGVESTVFTLNYPLSNRRLEFLSTIYW